MSVVPTCILCAEFMDACMFRYSALKNASVKYELQDEERSVLSLKLLHYSHACSPDENKQYCQPQ